MKGRPQQDEAAPYYFAYIDQAPGDDACELAERQLNEALPFLNTISDEKSLYRYAADKWTIREVLSHVSDTERVFTYRAMWFARGFETPLPSFDQNIGVEGAKANAIPWAALIEEFRVVRLASISFLRNLPDEAWTRRGIASDKPFSVRALAFMIPGHAEHHLKLLRSKYL